MHQSYNFALSSLNLVFGQMSFKVLVRDVAIVVNIDLLEYAVEFWLAIKKFILNLHKNVAQSFRLYIVDFFP